VDDKQSLRRSSRIRFALLYVVVVDGQCPTAAESTVDIDTAAKLYQGPRPCVNRCAPRWGRCRSTFGNCSRPIAPPSCRSRSSPRFPAAAVRGFRIDVFEAPALQAFAEHLDAATVAKSQAFLTSELGKRVVTADVALSRLSARPTSTR